MARKIDIDAISLEDRHRMIGPNLSFAASEAYKLLRTNLMFSVPSDGKCKIFGVTSAVRGEGKSTTSINIAYTMAQIGGKVLLVEADLRLPNIAKRMKLHASPGISNLLAGQCSKGDVIQRSQLLDNLCVITAGDIPPNPAELLGSRQMTAAMDAMADLFDVIIIDLPPVNLVSDALILSNLLSGMVVVVRQDYCEKGDVAEAVRQLQFVNAKILGFVMTGADISKKSYGKNNDYKNNYYKKGCKHTGSSFASRRQSGRRIP